MKLENNRYNIEDILNSIENKEFNTLSNDEINIFFDYLDEALNSNKLDNFTKNMKKITLPNIDIKNIDYINTMYIYKNKIYEQLKKDSINQIKIINNINEINKIFLENCKDIKFINIINTINNLEKKINFKSNVEIAQIFDYFTGNTFHNIDYVIGSYNQVNINDLLKQVIEKNINDNYLFFDYYSFILFHNHPNNSYFSEQDINLFNQKDYLKEMILFSNNKIYVLEKKENLNYVQNLDTFIFNEFTKKINTINYFDFKIILNNFTNKKSEYNENNKSFNLVDLIELIDDYKHFKVNHTDYIEATKEYQNIFNNYIQKYFDISYIEV